jgi:hypothetical protein
MSSLPDLSGFGNPKGLYLRNTVKYEKKKSFYLIGEISYFKNLWLN